MNCEGLGGLGQGFAVKSFPLREVLDAGSDVVTSYLPHYAFRNEMMPIFQILGEVGFGAICTIKDPAKFCLRQVSALHVHYPVTERLA